jgi:glutathione S-transferase
MITLWGRDTSINVQKVMWLLAELGLEYERIDCGGAFGGLKDPAYTAMNPNQTVPTLVDGDLVLWESNAILRYLADAYGAKTSFGGTAKQRAAADKWMEWYQSSVYASFQGIFYQKIRLRAAERNTETLATLMQIVTTQLSLADAVLQRQFFMGGDAISLADIPLAASLYRLYTMEIDRPAFAGIDAYYERLKNHAPYRDCVMISYESLRAKP